jgi:hypothetical protein
MIISTGIGHPQMQLQHFSLKVRVASRRRLCVDSRTLLSMRAAAPNAIYQASVRSDWLVERCEFELPVPIWVQSDDSIRLRFAKTTRTAKRHRPAARF